MNDLITNVSDIWNKLLALFSSYDFIIDTIDILLVAFIVYKLIKFMRESRALHVLKGIVLVLAVYFVINILDMQASTYLFQMVMNNFILAMIILFTPELRHALESVGRSRFLVLRMLGFNKNGVTNSRQKKAVAEIVKACNEMSEKKIGALIVIERDIALKDVVATGTKIDADISKEILGSIFFPNSPLHDGATIIRDGRICAAGCILPLSQNNNISTDLGTRHRASIGISEQSDAVVVVVSEETGQMSVVHKGRLERDVSDGVLLERLISFFVPSDDKSAKTVKSTKKDSEGDKDE